MQIYGPKGPVAYRISRSLMSPGINIPDSVTSSRNSPTVAIQERSVHQLELWTCMHGRQGGTRTHTRTHAPGSFERTRGGRQRTARGIFNK